MYIHVRSSRADPPTGRSRMPSQPDRARHPRWARDCRVRVTWPGGRCRWTHSAQGLPVPGGGRPDCDEGRQRHASVPKRPAPQPDVPSDSADDPALGCGPALRESPPCDPCAAVHGLREGMRRLVCVCCAAPRPVPRRGFRHCTNYILKRRGTEVYRVGAAASGLPSLKEYLIGWLAQHDIVATERTLVITTGCQQTLDLTRKLLVGPDDSMLLENPRSRARWVRCRHPGRA